jgi:hypothetical protein
LPSTLQRRVVQEEDVLLKFLNIFSLLTTKGLKKFWFFIFFTFVLNSWASASTQPPDLGATTTFSGVDLISDKVKSIDLTKAKKATVIVFLSAKCPCSASHQPVLSQLADLFGKEGFNFVGVHSNANEEIGFSQGHFKSAKLTFPVIQDKETKIADYFKAFKTPHVFVVSPDLKILFQGGVDNSKLVERATRHYLKDALSAINEGKQPVQREVRVLGCEIKRP